MTKYQCKECNTEFDNKLSFVNHIYRTHFKTEEYFLKHEGTNNGCVICGSTNVSFDGLFKGYKKTCSASCSGTYRRRVLKQDIEKDSKFRSKVSIQMKKEWEKDQTSRI
jgi:hypothetical protein